MQVASAVYPLPVTARDRDILWLHNSAMQARIEEAVVVLFARTCFSDVNEVHQKKTAGDILNCPQWTIVELFDSEESFKHRPDVVDLAFSVSRAGEMETDCRTIWTNWGRGLMVHAEISPRLC